MPEAPGFSVIPGSVVDQVLRGREREIAELVSRAYRLHGDGATVNPPSYFLRFPDRPDARIIALPAGVGGPVGVDGIKWVSSFPGNVHTGLPRASAVLLLNDPATGYAYACLEGSIVSAVRTASSAALAADVLSRGRCRPTRVGFVGAGLIARYVHTHLTGTGWEFAETGVHDLVSDHATAFRGYLEGTGADDIRVYDDLGALIRASDLVVFATVAATPHVSDPGWFDHAPLVLNVSLRDLAPEVIVSAANFVDDVDHCLRAQTSVHLAEQATGGRDFLDGTLYDVLTGAVEVDQDRTVVFSPFGLGVLDLVVGKHVHDAAKELGLLVGVDGFFHELDRYGKS